MVTDTSEQGLERLICTALAEHLCDPNTKTMEQPTAGHDGSGWREGSWKDYDREYGMTSVSLNSFLCTTRPRSQNH